MSAPRPATSVPPGRYGPIPRPGARRRALAALWTLAAAGVALVLWIGIDAARTPVTWTDVGFTVHDTGEVEVVYEVARIDPSVAVRCRLQALNHGFAQVGVVVVDIAPGDRRSDRYRDTIATSEPAVTAVVESCWVP